MEVIVGIVGLIVLIIFFAMASNIGELVRLSRERNKILKQLLNGDKIKNPSDLSNEDSIKDSSTPNEESEEPDEKAWYERRRGIWG